MSKRGQLTFPIERERFPDRNLHRGGRSFYFFDFDDNVMFLATPIFIFEKHSKREVALSTGHFAKVSHLIGKSGPYAEHRVDLDDHVGSFRHFRDRPEDRSDMQPFVRDIASAMTKLDVEWKGPSWDVFEHAVHNARPISIITARGHHPRTIEAGIQLLYDRQHLTRMPNYLGIYPVSHPETRRFLGDCDDRWSVPELKKAAIIHSIEQAMLQYGENEYHRFGMSDDSAENVALALQAFAELKSRFPKNAFFVFDTSKEPITRIEVLERGTHEEMVARHNQLSLFDSIIKA